MLTTVEKVIFLQDIDILSFTSTEDLARIAAVTDEIKLEPDQILFKESDISDALYIVIEGKVRLEKEEQLVMLASVKDAFGTWALFDSEPRVVTATAAESSRLLRIDREDFIDLLADHVQITQSILKTMVTKLRGLMARTRT
ncbi:MAG: cyclic nucleotide-binding domain-containing protein [candidate division Zixibacteria bacterium]|nr:cyclic nucleotide-binding domain-containing protein [candidate division Zixibacteria bacterium]